MSEFQAEKAYQDAFKQAIGSLVGAPGSEAQAKAWQAHAVIGQELADSVAEIRSREGFRQTLAPIALAQVDGKFEIPRSSLTVYLDGSVPKVWRRHQDPDPVPKPFCLTANVLYSEAEATNPSQELLDKLLQLALVPILTGEDRAWLSLMEASLAAAGSVPINYQALTEEALMQAWQKMESQRLPVGSLILPASVWTQWMALPINGPVIRDFEPVSKAEEVLEGKLGTWRGANVYTDAFRDPQLQVLKPGEIWVLTSPEFLGTICDLSALTSSQIHGSFVGEMKAGWFLEGSESMVVTQPHGVIKLCQNQ